MRMISEDSLDTIVLVFMSHKIGTVTRVETFKSARVNLVGKFRLKQVVTLDRTACLECPTLV